MGEYDRLREYLAKIEGTDLLLTFKKINEILSPNHLPQDAYDSRNWWSNTRGNPQACSWLGADWRVTTVSLMHKEVSFTKRPQS